MTGRAGALLLTPVLPRPHGSGRAMRAWAWLAELAREHAVHVLVCGPPEALEPGAPAATVRFLGPVLALPPLPQQLLGLALPAIVPARPALAFDWPRPAALPAIPPPVARIVVFRLYLHHVAQALAARFPAATLELDMDDLESATRAEVAGVLLRLGRPLAALRNALGAVQYRCIERGLRAGYGRAWFAAAEDLGHLGAGLARAGGVRVNRVPAPAPAAAGADARTHLLFTGTLNYPPNEEAVMTLCTRVLPRLAALGLGTLRLAVVGSRAGPRLAARLAADPRVDFFPDAPTLAPHYARALAVAVPLRAGGGTKLKTIEAIAHARPVVSTARGVRGLGAGPGQHFLPAESAGDFAAAIARLARDPALAARLGAAGQALWAERFRLA
jgi:hypothetical protein